MHAVSREIVIPPLFAVRNNRRACGFKSVNRVSSRFFIETIEAPDPRCRLLRLSREVIGKALAILIAVKILPEFSSPCCK